MTLRIFTKKSARDATREFVPSMPQFMQDYQLGAGGAGFARLEQGFPNIEKNHNPKTIAEAVQHFISLMDALRLNMAAIDQIQPLLSDLVEAVHKCTLDASFQSGKIEGWLKKLNAMSANDELDADAVRQLLFDLDQAYSAFHKALK